MAEPHDLIEQRRQPQVRVVGEAGREIAGLRRLKLRAMRALAPEALQTAKALSGRTGTAGSSSSRRLPGGLTAGVPMRDATGAPKRGSVGEQT